MIAKIDAATWGFLGLFVTGLFGLFGTLWTQRRTQRQNTNDHGTVREALHGLRDDVKALRSDVADVRDEQRQHLRWHLDQHARQNGDNNR